VEINPNTPPPPPPPPPPPAPPEEVEVLEEEDEREETNVIIIDQEADIDIVIEVEEEPEPVVEQIFDVVEENPEFIGGMAKLYEFLGKNIQYPEMAKENGIQGKVFVQFVVWKDGTIKDVKVVKGVHKTLDGEAQRVVKSMPKWTPGKQRGTAVNARFTLPIKFRIS
jgi:protein TonB